MVRLLTPSTFRVLLAALAMLAASAASAQTVVRDSIAMSRRVIHQEFVGAPPPPPPHSQEYYYSCQTDIIATWPDVRASLNATSVTYSTPGVSRTSPIPSENYPYTLSPGQSGVLAYTLPGSLIITGILYPEEPDWTRCDARRAQTAAISASFPTWYVVYTVTDGTPVARYTWRQDERLQVAFDGSFESKQSHEIDSSAPSGKRAVASYAWDFGDGQTGTGARPTHTYARADTFDVSLTVTDDDGQTNVHTEQVIVAASLLSYRIVSEETPVGLGDEISLVAMLKNVGIEDAEDIRVVRGFALASVFADSLFGNAKRAPEIASVQTPGPSVITLDRLAPGDSIEVRGRFSINALGMYVPSGQSDYVPIESEIHATLWSVRGTTLAGLPVKVVNACDNGECDDVTVVGPKESLSLEFRTDGVATTQVRTGLEYHAPESPLLYQVLGKSPVSPFSYTGTVDPNTGLVSDLEQHCHSSCADVVVTVLDPMTNEPIIGAAVTLTAGLIRADAIVTPEHSGGHFCGGGSCATILEVETDENGEARAYYSFPGIITAQDVDITAEVTVEGEKEEVAETLHLLPNQRTDFVQSIRLTDEEIQYLAVASLARNGGAFYNLAGEACEGFGKWVLGGASDLAVRPGTSYVLHGGANVLTEWICSLNPFTVLSSETAGNSKKVAETSMISWFGDRFRVPSGGLGTLNGPFPPPFVFYYDGDYYSAVLDGTEGLVGAAAGATVQLELYEVSWLREGGLAGNPLVPNVFFRMTGGTTEVTTLIEAGYLPETWLTPPRSEVLARIAQANADRIYVQQTLEQIQAGDFVWIDAGTPFEEFSEIRLSPEGRRVGSAADQELLLSRPLRFTHAADATLQVVPGDSVAAPPTRPILAGLDTTGTAGPLVLTWEMGLFETPVSYTVDVARDDQFTDVLTTATLTSEGGARPPQAFAYGEVQAGEVLYWRVRGENLIGAGEWSRTGRVEAVEGYGVPNEPVPGDGGAISAVALGAPFPNPARSASATVSVELPEAGPARLAVYDALGREVAVALDGVQSAGRHAVALDTSRLPSGVYVVRLEAGGAVAVQRLTVVR